MKALHITSLLLAAVVALAGCANEVDDPLVPNPPPPPIPVPVDEPTVETSAVDLPAGGATGAGAPDGNHG